MSGYYPDGVSGNEYAIAGADGDIEINDQRVYCDTEDCSHYEEQQVVDILDGEYYRTSAWGVWVCKYCNTTHNWEGDVPNDEDDYDYEPEDYMDRYGDDF